MQPLGLESSTLPLSHNTPCCSDVMANSVNPDQTAPEGAIWSQSTLFAQAYGIMFRIRMVSFLPYIFWLFDYLPK